MAAPGKKQLRPEDKISFGDPFSYAKAIIKEDVTYPIVPNCPIINVDDPEVFSASNIPVGVFFIMHYQGGNGRYETLCLRVPDDTRMVRDAELGNGFIIMTTRTNVTSPGGGNMM